jgi:hypothetical protein
MVENPFWVGLWKMVLDETQTYTDETMPLDEQYTSACERLAQKICREGDFYRVIGAEDLEPVPNDPAINWLIFGTIFGNYLAWRSGIKFFDRVKPNQ